MTLSAAVAAVSITAAVTISAAETAVSLTAVPTLSAATAAVSFTASATCSTAETGLDGPGTFPVSVSDAADACTDSASGAFTDSAAGASGFASAASGPCVCTAGCTTLRSVSCFFRGFSCSFSFCEARKASSSPGLSTLPRSQRLPVIHVSPVEKVTTLRRQWFSHPLQTSPLTCVKEKS